MDHRIERTRPAAALDIDAAVRIAASRQRPDDIIDARWIDVVVHDDGKAILIAAGETLRCDHASLLGMTGIALFDRNHGKLPRPGLVRPDTANIRNTGFLQFFPDVSRACDRA